MKNKILHKSCDAEMSGFAAAPPKTPLRAAQSFLCWTENKAAQQTCSVSQTDPFPSKVIPHQAFNTEPSPHLVFKFFPKPNLWRTGNDRCELTCSGCTLTEPHYTTLVSQPNLYQENICKRWKRFGSYSESISDLAPLFWPAGWRVGRKDREDAGRGPIPRKDWACWRTRLGCSWS